MVMRREARPRDSASWLSARWKHLSNAAWSCAEYAFYPGLLLLATPLFVALMGLEEYGLWVLVLAFCALNGPANLGLGPATVRFVSSLRGSGRLSEAKHVVGMYLTVAVSAGLLVGGLLWAGSGWLAEAFFARMGDSGRVTAALAIGGLILFLMQVDTVYGAVIKGSEAFRLGAVVDMTLKVVMLTLNLLVAWWFPTATAVLLSTAAAVLVCVIVRGVVASRVLGEGLLVPRRPRSVEGIDLYGFAGWSWVQSLSGALFQVVDRMVVGALLGAASVATYTICLQVAQQVHALPAAAMAIVFPLISRKVGEGDRHGVRRIRTLAMWSNIAIAATLAAILTLLSGPLLRIWMGAEFADQNRMLFLALIAAYGVLALSIGPYFLLLGMGDARFVSLLNLFGGAVSLACIVVAAESWGLMGIAAAKGVYGVVALTLYLRLRHEARAADARLGSRSAW